jgi:hypothetical protein
MRTLADLQAALNAIDLIYFGGHCAAHGTRVQLRKFRPNKNSVVYARHYLEEKAIVMNRVFQNPVVPDYVVHSVLFHEALHMAIGPDHDAGFNASEARWVHHMQSELWLSENHAWLMSEVKKLGARPGR